MSSVILTNWTVYYSGDTGGSLQIRWTGTTGTNTLRALYSALEDLFDNSGQMDDGTPMTAQTPTDYTIGLIDAGETGAWFIDPESIKHLTGGGLRTQSWARVTGTNIGIIKLPYTVGGGSDFVPSDLGKHVDLGTNDGTLLYYNSSDLECWIRPDTSAADDDFDDSGTLTVASGTGSVTIGASSNTTGEMTWSNIFTLGALQSNTTIYVSQNNSVISNTESSGSGRWWGDGHLDILVLTTDQGDLVDRGLLTLYARQYSKKYCYYVTDVSAGGRTPVPLSTSSDANNTTGYRTFTGSSGTGTFTSGNAIYTGASWAAATAKGILTVDASGTTPTITYYLIHNLTELSGTIYEYDFVTDSRATHCVVGTPTNTGPASQSMSIAFGLDQTQDVNADSTNEDYSVMIDLAGTIAVADMNERLKYITRRGETSTLDGIEGQQYIGLDYRVDYLALNGTIADGSTLTQTLADATTATTEVVAHSIADGYLMLRDTRGTLEYGTGANNLVLDGGNWVTMTGAATVTVITPPLEHPFGSFAGGKFFGARGVGIKNVPAGDAQNYELIDNDGTRIVPPTSIAIIVSGIVSGDRVSVFRTTGDNEIIDKTYLHSHASNNSSATTSWEVDSSTPIPADTPGTGYVRLVKTSTSTEERKQYTGWSGNVFTLASAHSGGYGASDTAYVPYIDEQATGTSISKSVTYVTDRYVLTRVRIKGIVPFNVKGQITSSGYTATAIRTADTITA
jgi:hypothetical protein